MEMVPAVVKHVQIKRSNKKKSLEMVFLCQTKDDRVFYPSRSFASTPCSTGPNAGTPIKVVNTRDLAGVMECEPEIGTVVRGRQALVGKEAILKLELDTPNIVPETGLPEREPVLRASAIYFGGMADEVSEDEFING